MSLLAPGLSDFADDPMFSDMRQYLTIAKGASADDVEAGLQSQVRSFADTAIMSIDFPDRIRMVCTAPLPRVMPQVSSYRPNSPRQIYAPVVFDVLIPQFKLHVMEHLFECRDKPPGFAQRRFSFTLCVGPELMFPEARGIVWDARRWAPDSESNTGPGIVPYDFTPWDSSGAQCIDTHLEVMDLIVQLEQHNDKALHSHLRYGVHYSAELVLQLCFMPESSPLAVHRLRVGAVGTSTARQAGLVRSFHSYSHLALADARPRSDSSQAHLKCTAHVRVWAARAGPRPTHSACCGGTP